MNRIDMQLFILSKHENQSPARLFHRDCHGLATETCPQRKDPRSYGLGAVFDLASLAPPSVSRL